MRDLLTATLGALAVLAVLAIVQTDDLAEIKAQAAGLEDRLHAAQIERGWLLVTPLPGALFRPRPEPALDEAMACLVGE